MTLPVWAQDTVLALFVAYFQIAGTRRVAPSQEVAQLAHPAELGYLLLAVAGMALLLRRRWPLAVFFTTAAISLVYYVAGYPDGPGWIALFVAAYTVTARGDGQRSVQIVGGTILLLTLVWLLTADLTPIDTAGWVFFRIGTAIMAVVLGDMLRARRVVAAEALERAERAERTREEEARRRVDAERLRIAREVHDTVAHAIAVINVQAGVTAHVLDRRPERVRETLVTIEQTSAPRSGCCVRPPAGALRLPGSPRSMSWWGWRARRGSTSRSRPAPRHGSCRAASTGPPTGSCRNPSPTRSATRVPRGSPSRSAMARATWKCGSPTTAAAPARAPAPPAVAGGSSGCGSAQRC